MKKIYQILCAALLVAGAATNISCTDYQDEIDALDYRVTVLENLVKKINNNIEAMQVTVTAMQNGDYITGVRDTVAEDEYRTLARNLKIPYGGKLIDA